MKKILFLTLSIVMLLSNSAITSASPYANTTERVNTAYQSYTFVGTFFFYTSSYYRKLDVYERCDVIDGYLVSTYYARYEGKYYRLFPCNEKLGNNTYNYYVSIDSKWYVKI